MRRLVLLCGVAALAAGCDRVFGLRPDGEADAAVADAAADRDLDRDHIADADDNCVGDPNEGQDDTDHDGIGDVCDPHVDRADILVSLELFDASPRRWEPNPSTGWSKTEQGLVSPLGGALVYQSMPKLTLPTVRVGFTIVAFGPRTGGSNNEVALELEGPDTANCKLREDIADDHSDLILHVRGNANPMTKIFAPELAAGTRYVAAYTRGVMSTCSVAGTTQTKPDALADAFSSVPTLRVVGTSISIDFIALYAAMP